MNESDVAARPDEFRWDAFNTLWSDDAARTEILNQLLLNVEIQVETVEKG